MGWSSCMSSTWWFSYWPMVQRCHCSSQHGYYHVCPSTWQFPIRPLVRKLGVCWCRTQGCRFGLDSRLIFFHRHSMNLIHCSLSACWFFHDAIDCMGWTSVVHFIHFEHLCHLLQKKSVEQRHPDFTWLVMVWIEGYSNYSKP
jgi:hypothetical protein